MNKMKDLQFMVCVQCVTYNHAKYIQDTMQGFVRQVTNYPVVYVIIDDASTDGEANIIASFLEEQFKIVDSYSLLKKDTSDYSLRFVEHIENNNCFFAVYTCKYNHYQAKKPKDPYFDVWKQLSKYHAICEGDDFWIDDYKLDKQVRMMEDNPNASICHTQFYRLDEETDRIYLFDNTTTLQIHNSHDKITLVQNILDNNRYRIQTLTILYRKSSYDKIAHLLTMENEKYLMGDTQLCSCLASIGEVLYLSDCTGVYRQHLGSVSRQTDTKKKMRFSLSITEMRCDYASYLGMPASFIKRCKKDYKHALLFYKYKYDPKYRAFIHLPLSTCFERNLFKLISSNVVSSLAYSFTSVQKIF